MSDSSLVISETSIWHHLCLALNTPWSTLQARDGTWELKLHLRLIHNTAPSHGSVTCHLTAFILGSWPHSLELCLRLPKASMDGRDQKIENNNSSTNTGVWGISHLTEGNDCLYLYLTLFIVLSSTSSVRRFQNVRHLWIQWPCLINIVSFNTWKWRLFLLTFADVTSIEVTIAQLHLRELSKIQSL